MIQQLIIKGKIDQAIHQLIKQNIEGAEILSQEWEKLERDNLIGIVKRDDYTTERNRIVNRILKLSSNQNNTDMNKLPSSIQKYSEGLQTIIAENKRIRPKLVKEAKALLAQFRNYEDEKKSNPSYDISNKKRDNLYRDYYKIYQNLSKEKDKALEEVAAKVNKLISARVPTYFNLSQAYAICSGRGFSNDWIKEQLQNQPNDKFTKVRIAELIENYIASFQKK